MGRAGHPHLIATSAAYLLYSQNSKNRRAGVAHRLRDTAAALATKGEGLAVGLSGSAIAGSADVWLPLSGLGYHYGAEADLCLLLVLEKGQFKVWLRLPNVAIHICFVDVGRSHDSSHTKDGVVNMRQH